MKYDFQAAQRYIVRCSNGNKHDGRCVEANENEVTLATTLYGAVGGADLTTIVLDQVVSVTAKEVPLPESFWEAVKNLPKDED